MISFLWGISASSSLVTALFFLRFWHDTRDRLFAALSAAFCLLALNYMALALFPTVDETRHFTYIVRLVAFALIIAGILEQTSRTRVTRGAFTR